MAIKDSIPCDMNVPTSDGKILYDIIIKNKYKYDYIKDLPNLETTVDNSGAGISISYKKSEK